MPAEILFTDQDLTTMVRMYEQGKTIKQIGIEFGVSPTPIQRQLRLKGVVIRNGGPSLVIPSEDVPKIIDLYKSGTSSASISKLYGCSTEPVKRILHEAGLTPRRVRGGYGAVTPGIRKKILKLYRQGYSRNAISDLLGIWTNPIGRVLREERVELRDDRRRRGANCPIYKGRYRAATGYVHCYLTEDSPFASMRIGKHVLEHRLVMAEHLGRPLLVHERVHHKNGIKDDNRIENLELWEYSHPPGQRLGDKIPHCPTCTCAAH